MTSPSADDFLKVLRKYERDLVAFLKQTDVVVKLPTELLRNCVISPSLKGKFDSLDNERLSPQLQVRYLLQQVGEQVKKDSCVFENFLQTLSGLDGKGKEVCEYLREELDVSLSNQEATVDCDGEQITSNNKEKSVCLRQEDVRRLVVILAGVSDKWNEIGIMLDLPGPVIKDCNKGSSVVNLNYILWNWIVSNQATLEKLKSALRSVVVNAGRAADDLDKDFKTAIPYVSKRSGTLSSSLVTYQSCETEVADGMSTLLEVQVSSTESVSYQWMKDGQPLLNSEDYSGTCTNILFVSQASQRAGGSYACLVRTGDKKVYSDGIKVVVKFSPIKAHILNLYSKYREVPVDSWPPVGSSAFIDLAMTTSSKLCTVPISSALQGSVDSLIASKVSIKYKEAFKLYKTGALILVEGRPGSGKSTFIQKLVLDWTKGFILKGAKMVFLIPLRHGCLSGTEENLFQILNMIYYRGSKSLFMRDDMEHMEDCDGEGICFVMDGLDEYHPLEESQSVILKLLNKTYLPQAMVIVSSRPVATSILKQNAPITECFELIGFSKEDILKYIDSFPFPPEAAGNKADPENLKAYLRSHSNVFNMCYLPVNAAMICSLYHDRKGDIPTTETKMYEQFITLVIIRHFKRNKKPTSLASLDKLSGKDQECFDHLCHLAFDMTVNSRHVLTWSQTSAGPHDASFLGLVTVDRVVQLTNPEARQTCAFLHFTFQEFLAAYYISRLDCEGQIEIIKKNSLKLKPYLCNVWKFFCGQVNFAPIHFLKFLYYVMDGAKIINFFLCPFQFAFESQQDAVCSCLIDVTRGIAFEAYLNPSDIAAVTFVISNRMCRTVCLLEHCTDEDGVLKIFACVDSMKLCFLSSLILSNMSLGSASARAIATRLKYCKNLKVLNLSRNNFCSSDIIGMIQELKPFMTELDLSNNNIGDDIADYVHILGNTRRAFSLNLSYCKISSKGIMTILCGLKKSVNELYLQGNSSITCKDLIDLASSKDTLGYEYDYLEDLHISLSDFEELAKLKLKYPNIYFGRVKVMRRRSSLSVAESHPLIKKFIRSFETALDELVCPRHHSQPVSLATLLLPILKVYMY